MKKAIKMIILVLGLTLTVSFLLFISNEWNRAAFGAHGHIEKGTKFGLTIGDSKSEVVSYLVARGLTDGTTLEINETHYNPQSCHNHIYSDEYEVQIWDDRSWRRGTICVAFLDGKLARVSWYYGMFQP